MAVLKGSSETINDIVNRYTLTQSKMSGKHATSVSSLLRVPREADLQARQMPGPRDPAPTKTSNEVSPTDIYSGICWDSVGPAASPGEEQ